MMNNFDKQARVYARVLLRKGLNLQPGQRLFVRKAPVEAAAFIRILTEVAYQEGARYVALFWEDSAATRIRYEQAPEDSFEEFPHWQTDALVQGAEQNDAFLVFSCEDPQLTAGIPSERVSTTVRTANRHMEPFRRYVMNNDIAWLVAAVPTPGWAQAIFSGVPADEAVDKLWETIFQLCRVDQPSPEAAWDEHARLTAERVRFLDERSYHALHFRGPGTDLVVGLADGHEWHGVGSTNKAGVFFIPNMPTEEVFTAPHRGRVNGTVRNTRPLVVDGTTIDEFELEFREGKVIRAVAAKGQEALTSLLETDEGACYLGEVALVPNSSPVSRSGLMFHNTLFDENASCHLALGRAYPFCVEHEGEDDFLARGGNRSLIHYDFMIGSGETDVIGVAADGTEETLIHKGEWVV